MLPNLVLHGALPSGALGLLMLHQAGGSPGRVFGVIEHDSSRCSQKLRDFSLERRLARARDRRPVKSRAAGERKYNFAMSKRDQPAVRERGPKSR